MNQTINLPTARTAIQTLGASKIREVANHAMGNLDVLPFWFGEPYQPTPQFIRQAAAEALAAGDTFYHQNLGLPELREALAQYLTHLHAPVSASRIAVTSSGVNALMLCAQVILNPGDQVVAITPLWPNLIEIPAILGAVVTRVAIELNSTTHEWELPIEQLLAQITANTKAVMVNSPNNPTGWTMSSEHMQLLLAHCRTLGVWILSDEAYNRLTFDGRYQAPSILDFANHTDRVLVANTFSKTWQMTGWRLGWIVAPTGMDTDLGKLIEFNTSCAPGFVQQGGLAAVQSGPQVIYQFVDELSQNARLMTAMLNAMPRIQVGRPTGAMYAFFKVDGEPDSLALAKRLVQTQGLGLAPGIAFGMESEGYLRWCFAKPSSMLEQGIEKLKKALG
jgi:aspartate/methionine/tyrosine aminotransferase